MAWVAGNYSAGGGPWSLGGHGTNQPWAGGGSEPEKLEGHADRKFTELVRGKVRELLLVWFKRPHKLSCCSHMVSP